MPERVLELCMTDQRRVLVRLWCVCVCMCSKLYINFTTYFILSNSYILLGKIFTTYRKLSFHVLFGKVCSADGRLQTPADRILLSNEYFTFMNRFNSFMSSGPEGCCYTPVVIFPVLYACVLCTS